MAVGNVATAAFTLGLIVSWYTANIGVLLMNKFLLSSSKFNYPVLITLCHMSATMLLGAVVHTTGLMPAKPIRSRSQLSKVIVLASIFCLTIVLGNASLKYLPVSFNQMIGSTTPFFTAILAYFVQKQRESRYTYAALVPVALGVVISSGGEPHFHFIGFMCCVLATAFRALKSVVQSMIMVDPSDKLDPMSLLLYMSMVSVVLLVPMALLLEPGCFTELAMRVSGEQGFAAWLAANSFLAYFVNLLNFLVTKYTSALTLQVLGNAKGVVAAIVSVFVFKNVVTWVGWTGYAVTVAGVFLYSETKRMAKAAANSKVPREDSQELAKDQQTPLLDPRSSYFRSTTTSTGSG